MRRRARRNVTAAALAAVAFGAAACTAGTPSPLPVATDPLLTVGTRGGLCADGPCGTTIVVERDGRIRQAAKPPSDFGTVPPVALAALEAAIRQTDFATLRTVPFTKTCPTAYDGQETVFEFGGPGRRFRLCRPRPTDAAGRPSDEGSEASEWVTPRGRPPRRAP